MTNLLPIDARTGESLAAPLAESTAAEIEGAARRAADCFPRYATASDARRADLLRGLASALEANRDSLVSLADRETALGAPRLSGELDRTAFQLRAFADYVSNGAHRRLRVDDAVAGAPPAGHPELVRVFVPIGPVAVFAASNFPLAFSVLGGDTAAALAAACPVVVKAHPAHPLLSRRTFEIARAETAKRELPADVLQLVQGPSHEIGVALATAPEIAAVAFTGSLAGGRALKKAIDARERPIPFYGELGSINPIVAFPEALAAGGKDLAVTLAKSITQGSGQFCTSPGVLLFIDDPRSRRFLAWLAEALADAPTHAMLTKAMRARFETSVAALERASRGKRLSSEPARVAGPTPALFEMPLEEFVAVPAFREEVFGPFCVAVPCREPDDLIASLRAIGGSLSATIWASPSEHASARPVVAAAVEIAGRILFAGVPTGVAVSGAQQHGGPWPSSTRPDTTSVGLAAIERFLRPVCFQDAGASIGLLPDGLVDLLSIRRGTPSRP